MRVTFNPGEPKTLKDLFSPNITFLDISVTRNFVYIILTNSVDTYVHKAFPVISMDNFTESVIFRVDRKSFLSLVKKGHVAIYIPDNNVVEITFNSDIYSHTMTRKYQGSDRSSFVKFAEALKSSSSYKAASLSSLEEYSSLLRQFSGLVIIEDGVLHSSTEFVQMYCKVDAPNLTLYPSSIYYLLRVTESQYTFQDSVIGTGPDCVVILKQFSYGSYTTLPWIEDPKGTKRTHLAKVDFSSACLLAQSCDLEGTAILDFDMRTIVFHEGRDIYETNIGVHSLDSRDAYKRRKAAEDPNDMSFLEQLDDNSVATVEKLFPKLQISTRMFRSILPTVPRSNVNVSLRRDFILMDIKEKLFFVVGRSEVS